MYDETMRNVFVQFENACSLVSGETTNCYYRAGFSDAVAFVLGWRDGNALQSKF